MPFSAWRRTTEPGACAFCLMLASRGAVYRSQQTAGASDKYHTHCHCGAELETEPANADEVVIAPEDANRIIEFTNRHGSRYRYDLSDFRNRGVTKPPATPMQPPVAVPKTLAERVADGRDKYRRALANDAQDFDAHLDAIDSVGADVLDEVKSKVARKVADGPQASAADLARAKARIEKEEAKLQRAAAKEINLRADLKEQVEADFRKRYPEFDWSQDDLVDKLEFRWKLTEHAAALRKAKAARDKQRKVRDAAKADLDMLTATPEVGSPAYNQIWQDALRETLDEIRGIGGRTPEWISPSTRKAVARGDVKNAMDRAGAMYPREWLDLWRNRHPEVTIGTARRGYNRMGYEIKLSKTTNPRVAGQIADDPLGLVRVAVHEIGHSMEDVVPGLRNAEYAFLRRRALRDAKQTESVRPTMIYPGEYGYKDDFGEHYTGKVYVPQYVANPLGTPGRNYEVFTTGAESLLGGQRRMMLRTSDGEFDDEFARFIIGAMSVL